MDLGKNIYEFRISKNLSQGDLAELLDVSRQSVSKWETETAIPDLDKLVKMCEVFGVTLDELTGRIPCAKDEVGKVTISERTSAFTTAKIVGYILLATTLFASILLFVLAKDIEDFYIPLPILLSAFVCSMICLCVKNNIGYWCTWAILAPFCLLSVHVVGLPILSMIGCTQITVYIVMTVVASKIFKNCIVHTSKRKSVFLVLGFLIAISIYITALIFIPLGWLWMCIINYITYAILALLLTYGVCYVKSLKNK